MAALLLWGSSLAWAQVSTAASQGAASTPAVVERAASAPPAGELTVQPTVALGRKAYTSYCTRCHGINLVVTSSAFYDLRTFPPHDKARFMRSVKEGIRAMPAWNGIVKPEEMESIWLYVLSVTGSSTR